MVKVIDETPGCASIILKPNCSLSWTSSVFFLVVIAATALGIASVFAYLGAWLILPFSGLEILLLTIVFYMISCRARNMQVITFTDTELIVEKGKAKPVKTWRYHRLWTTICISKGHPWYRSKIILRSHGKDLQIGEFLDEEEIKVLVSTLRRLVSATRE